MMPRARPALVASTVLLLAWACADKQTIADIRLPCEADVWGPDLAMTPGAKDRPVESCWYEADNGEDVFLVADKLRVLLHAHGRNDPLQGAVFLNLRGAGGTVEACKRLGLATSTASLSLRVETLPLFGGWKQVSKASGTLTCRISERYMHVSTSSDTRLNVVLRLEMDATSNRFVEP